MISDEMLMAYADGELPEADRAAVEAAVARDPALAARVEAHRALRARVVGAYAPVGEERIPDSLLALLSGAEARPDLAAAPATPAEVVDLAGARARREQSRAAKPSRAPWKIPQWAPMAACLVIGVFIGRAAMIERPMVSSQGGVIVARGDLAKALDSQLAAKPQAASVVKVGLSFREGSGTYCRTFQTAAKAAGAGRTAGIAGIACRDPRAWTVRMTAQPSPGADGQYRMAASGTPAPVLAAVQEMIAGEPLDAAGEAKARATRWKR